MADCNFEFWISFLDFLLNIILNFFLVIFCVIFLSFILGVMAGYGHPSTRSWTLPFGLLKIFKLEVKLNLNLKWTWTWSWTWTWIQFELLFFWILFWTYFQVFLYIEFGQDFWSADAYKIQMRAPFLHVRRSRKSKSLAGWWKL